MISLLMCGVMSMILLISDGYRLLILSFKSFSWKLVIIIVINVNFLV